MIKFLIGGSPCTEWSIAKQGRETMPRGKGWGLFKNYLVAKERFKPDFFYMRTTEARRRKSKRKYQSSSVYHFSILMNWSFDGKTEN